MQHGRHQLLTLTSVFSSSRAANLRKCCCSCRQLTRHSCATWLPTCEWMMRQMMGCMHPSPTWCGGTGTPTLVTLAALSMMAGVWCVPGLAIVGHCSLALELLAAGRLTYRSNRTALGGCSLKRCLQKGDPPGLPARCCPWFLLLSFKKAFTKP